MNACHASRWIVAPSALLFWFAATAHATTYYWDTNGSTAGIGSAGGAAAAWLTDSWATGSTGTLPTAAWPNIQPGNADEAVFLGTAGTVNLGADVYANALRFQTNGYQLASTGGALHLDGANPTIDVSLPSNNNTATISAPIVGDSGFTLAGNSLSGSLKFLVLANTNTIAPNSFSGTLTIEAGGALRLGGGVANEQIPDDVDLAVAGVIDFVTSGGASDGKQERVRNVTVSGSAANFSIGNEADFVVNSIAASNTGTGQGIAINGNFGNAPNVPGRLIINGWADGTGHLTLDNARLQFNVTSASAAIGGRVLLSGNIYSSGNSQVYNNNGGTTPDDNHFDNKALDFTAAAHTIDVADGTLTFTSRTASQPVDVTATNPGGTTLTKTGPGVLFYEHAVQSTFTGTNRIEEGTLRLGAGERLSNTAQLEVAGGTFDMQSFAERVAGVLLDGGTIDGDSNATLSSANGFEFREGLVNVRLSSFAGGLVKSTAGTVELARANSYAGTTVIDEGLLLVNGAHSGGDAYMVNAAGTLGGTGSIDSPVSVEGTLAPGTSIGTFTVSNVVSFDVGSHLAVELSGATADKLVAGDLNLDASEYLDVSVVGTLTGSSWLIAEYAGVLTGQFDAVTPGFRADYGTPGQIHLKLVPEPATATFAGMAVGCFVAAGRSCTMLRPLSFSPDREFVS